MKRLNLIAIAVFIGYICLCLFAIDHVQPIGEPLTHPTVTPTCNDMAHHRARALRIRRHDYPVIDPGEVYQIDADYGEGGPDMPTLVLNIDYYASPLGSPSGTGTLLSPWDLQTALKKTAQITAGKVLALKGGLYRGRFFSSLNPASQAWVIAVPGETPVLDGYIYTTLVSPMAATPGTENITVADGSVFLRAWQEGATTIMADGEALFINNISGNTINVTRVASGTSPETDPPTAVATAHAAGTILRLSGSVLELKSTSRNVNYRGLKITNSDPLRNWETDGAEGRRGNGIHDLGKNNSYSWNYITDNLNGIFTGSASEGAQSDGNIIVNNGVFGGPNGIRGGYGHGLYLENINQQNFHQDNIILNTLNEGAQLYGRSAQVLGGSFLNNIIAGSGAPCTFPSRVRNLIVGAESGAQMPFATVSGNVLFHPHNVGGYNCTIGYGIGIADVVMNDNYILGGSVGMEITSNTTHIAGLRNVFYLRSSSAVNLNSIQAAFTWNNQKYYSTAANADRFGNLTAHTNQTFALWKDATGYDAAGSIFSGNMPDTVIFRYILDPWGNVRANIVVMVPSGATQVPVNLAINGPVPEHVHGLYHGQPFVIKNAFDFEGPDVYTGVYDENSPTITLPLTGAARNVKQAVGAGFVPATTLPDFGVFVLIPTG